MIVRSQGFQEVRRLLGFPKEQRPKNDQIVSSLLAVERLMMVEANSMNAGWSIKNIAVPSVIDQAEYTLTPRVADKNTIGKPLFAYRELDSTNILPVPFTDYLSEFHHQKYNFWFAPSNLSGAAMPYGNGEQLAFYRDGATVKMRIFPIPSEVRTYTIVYAIGLQDWSEFEWSDEIQFPEFCDYLWRRTAFDNIRFCEWSGFSYQDNRDYRNEIRQDLQISIAEIAPEWKNFIRKVNEDSTISEIGNWFD